MGEPNGVHEKGMTFTQHMAEMQQEFPEASGEFTALMQEIMLSAKIISREVRKAGLADALGLTGHVNVQGEAVQYLDEFANQTIIRNVHHGGHLCALSSEENEDLIEIPDRYPTGKYTLTIDPLDGSSNIDANVSIGTIWSIHRRRTPEGPGQIEDVLQPGRDQVAAGYVIYGSSTILVYTSGAGVHGFTLDPSIGEFLLSHPNLRTPEIGLIYSTNEGHSASWHPRDQQAVEIWKSGRGPGGKPYSARYIGSLVADFHRNLLYGGVFLYPPTVSHREGKLRLLSEAAPLAMVCEAAGGLASTGRGRILDVIPTSLHQRVPLYIGSRREVELIERLYREIPD
ncbi:MAG: class 1 fructose-bisphosphatase [Candidatus Eisenbacteria bacterium]|nr:class 1 fructose-bisphosphatase [Candidatus Eisenbacteria bacterium]